MVLSILAKPRESNMKVKISGETNGGGYEHFQLKNYEEIGDQFCGSLKILPGGGVMALGFTTNTGHTHTKFSEVYMVARGTLKIALYSPINNQTNEVELGELDSIKIPAGIGHKVIGGSADNAVIVTCDPVFIPGDEQRCDILEDRYATSSDTLTDLGVPARPHYFTEPGA
jgi:mannose-6-phosphate isomerase-like protein (cupin superfamily)